jgi:hypothetical protein
MIATTNQNPAAALSALFATELNSSELVITAVPMSVPPSLLRESNYFVAPVLVSGHAANQAAQNI